MYHYHAENIKKCKSKWNESQIDILVKMIEPI